LFVIVFVLILSFSVYIWTRFFLTVPKFVLTKVEKVQKWQ